MVGCWVMVVELCGNVADLAAELQQKVLKISCGKLHKKS